MLWKGRQLEKRLRRGGRGAVVIEIALLLPVLLFLVIALIEFGRAIWTRSMLDYAVQAAARCAVIDEVRCATPEHIRDFAADRTAGLDVSPADFTVTEAACGMEVSVSIPYHAAAGAFLPLPVTLSATACFPL